MEIFIRTCLVESRLFEICLDTELGLGFTTFFWLSVSPFSSLMTGSSRSRSSSQEVPQGPLNLNIKTRQSIFLYSILVQRSDWRIFFIKGFNYDSSIAIWKNTRISNEINDYFVSISYIWFWLPCFNVVSYIEYLLAATLHLFSKLALRKYILNLCFNYTIKNLLAKQ